MTVETVRFELDDDGRTWKAWYDGRADLVGRGATRVDALRELRQAVLAHREE